MDRPGGHRQRFAGAVGLTADAVDVVLERSLEDVDDLLARMPVPDDRSLRAELDAVLDDHAARDAELVMLKIGAEEARGLLDGGAHFVLLWGVGGNDAIQHRFGRRPSRP